MLRLLSLSITNDVSRLVHYFGPDLKYHNTFWIVCHLIEFNFIFVLHSICHNL